MPKSGEINTSAVLLLETENKIKLLEPYKGAKVHHQMQCMVCDHIWSATPLSKRQTFKKNRVSGCPNCDKNRREAKHIAARQSNIQELKARGIEILSDYDGRRAYKEGYVKIQVRNIKCGHIFECSPANLLANNVECSVCGPQKRAAPLTAWSKANSIRWQETASDWKLYKSKVAELTRLTYNKHKSIINPNNFPRGKAGVEGAYHVDHIVPIRFCFDNNIPIEVCADITNLQMIGWRENVGSRHHLKGTIPPLFYKYIATGSKLDQYANTLIDILPNADKFVTVAGIVATVYDRESNRAILVIPIDASMADNKAALMAYRAFTEAEINFTILFEDELANKQLLRSKLMHYSGINQAQRIHARKCKIRECTKEEKRTLLNNNHVQGNDNSSIAYGAYYNDELVAVMTFAKPRVAMGQKTKSEREWELSRFCTNTNYRIPGVASKLLKHFQANHDWVKIYSYADKRWSIGNMYKQMGFVQTNDNPPDYFYVVEGKRKHRWNYRKDILKDTLEQYDVNLTEVQNMKNHGFWRVWGCGTIKFEMLNEDNNN